jgi:hypothetical protein
VANWLETKTQKLMSPKRSLADFPNLEMIERLFPVFYIHLAPSSPRGPWIFPVYPTKHKMVTEWMQGEKEAQQWALQ